ncbi:hypothetical protein J4210_06235 [Candidatus Woesearchaeota archaeon]|nr:hypothetical protein [Candidatus Woesearchaeota archaeon]
MDQTQPCQQYIHEAATVSCYGARNFKEDVATIVELVYLLNFSKREEHPNFDQHLARIDQRAYSLVVEKIHLATEFGFYSPAEEKIAADLVRVRFTRNRSPP